MNLTVDSTFQPNDIWPLHSLLTPLSMLNPLTWRMNDLYNSFTILCLIYVFDEIEMSLNHSSRKESWCESTSITPYHTVYRDMCTISVFVAQKSIRLCWTLWPNNNTVHQGSSYFYGDDMFLALLAPLLFSLPPLSLLYHLIFFPLLSSIFRLRSAPGSNFYCFFSLMWARSGPDAIQLSSITLTNGLYWFRTLQSTSQWDLQLGTSFF